MRLIKLFLFVASMAGLFGCSKPTSSDPDNNNNPGPSAPVYYFNCKVNGVFTEFAAQTLIKDYPDDPKQIFLVGQKNNTDLPSLTFTLNKTGTGWKDGLTYVLDEKDLVSFVEYKNVAKLIFKSTATPASVSSGLTLHFDKIVLPKDQYASGTFSGTLQLEENITSVVITEGKFKVQFLN